MSSVTLRNVVKRYGDLEVVHSVNLDIADEEFVVFVGPSGCGKSTLLRMIAGLEDISGGEIMIDDLVVNRLPPRGRNIAMVFQDYALYPHLSVRENMGFGLKMRRAPRDLIEQKVQEAARILKIEALLERRPRELSGGQRQRVAMGRAIVRDPRVFLFDEPLSNLDAKLRTEMRTEIKRLHQQLRSTIVYVTHDQVEAMTLANRIVVLNNGHIEQVGSPSDVYNRPASQFVAGFTGSPPMNFVDGTLADDNGHLVVDLGANGRVPVPEALKPAAEGRSDNRIVFGVRPEHVFRADPDGRDGKRARLSVPVSVTEPLGSDTLAFLGMGGTEMIARFTPEDAPEPGDVIDVTINPDQIHLFDPENGRALAS